MIDLTDSPKSLSIPHRGVTLSRRASDKPMTYNVASPAEARLNEREFLPGRWLDRWEGEGGAWLRELSNPTES
jgi:hypothetical protein